MYTQPYTNNDDHSQKRDQGVAPRIYPTLASSKPTITIINLTRGQSEAQYSIDHNRDPNGRPSHGAWFSSETHVKDERPRRRLHRTHAFRMNKSSNEETFSCPDYSSSSSSEEDLDEEYFSNLTTPSPTPASPPASANNHLLLLHRLSRRSIILDSPNPEVAPHIVITPPPQAYEWCDWTASCSNWVGEQDGRLLCVPPKTWGPRVEAPPSEAQVELERVDHCTATIKFEEIFVSPSFDGPNRVFGRTRFEKRIASASEEREYMGPLVRILNRQLYKACVIAASIKSLARSPKSDSGDSTILFSVDQPFEWTDPATPLLSSAYKARGNTVLESDYPSTVPHIIISQPAEVLNPWVVYMNNGTLSKDYQDWDRLMTVPRDSVFYAGRLIKIDRGPPPVQYIVNADAITGACGESRDADAEDTHSISETTISERSESPPHTPVTGSTDDVLFSEDELITITVCPVDFDADEPGCDPQLVQSCRVPLNLGRRGCSKLDLDVSVPDSSDEKNGRENKRGVHADDRTPGLERSPSLVTNVNQVQRFDEERVTPAETDLYPPASNSNPPPPHSDSPDMCFAGAQLYEADSKTWTPSRSTMVSNYECAFENAFGGCADDEEDEDELPPFDDWYTNIAERNGMAY